MKRMLLLCMIAALLVMPFSLAALNNAYGYYSFDSDASDDSGNLRNGVVTGASHETVSCKLGGGCYSFDGVGDNINLNNSDTAASNITIGGWFKFDDVASDDWLISKYQAAPELELYTVAAGGLYCNFRDTGGGQHSADVAAHGFSTGIWYFIACSRDVTNNQILMYINSTVWGSNNDSYVPRDVSANLQLGERGDSYGDFAGDIDEVFVYERVLTQTEINQLYNADIGHNPYDVTPPVTVTEVFIYDLYDNNTITAVNVTIYNGSDVYTNSTDATGSAIFNVQGDFIVNLTHPSYFDTYPSFNATNGTILAYNMAGAFVEIQGYDVEDNQVNVFNVTSGTHKNTTAAGSTRLLLKPNSTNTLTFDGEDYINLSLDYTASDQDTGSFNFTNLYQSLLNITATDGASAVSNFTTNITGVLNRTLTTTSGNVTVGVLFGDITIDLNATGYSEAQKNITLASGNVSPQVEILVLTLNTFNLTITDEVTGAIVTEVMTIEVISDVFSANYTTDTGKINVSFLTPADYTIRYRGENYTERDYYQNLTPQSFWLIDLYAIKTTDADTVTVTVVDTAGQPVETATVKLLRYFVTCNCYEVVEMDRTSFSGNSHFSVQPEIGFYKWIIEYGGVTRLTSTTAENFYTNTRTFTLNLGDDIYESFRGLTGLGHTLTINRATETIAFTWNDPEGLVLEGCLDAEYLVGIEYVSVGENCANGATGSVLVSIPDINNTRYRYTAYVDTSTQFSIATLFSGYTEIVDDFDFQQYGLFIGIGITITLVMFFSFSAAGTIIVTVIGVAMMNILGFMNFTITFVTGFATLVLGLTLYLMRR